MTSTRQCGGDPTWGIDSGLSEVLVKASRFFRKRDASVDLRSPHQIGGRVGDSSYRDRRAHDDVVRSRHWDRVGSDRR